MRSNVLSNKKYIKLCFRNQISALCCILEGMQVQAACTSSLHFIADLELTLFCTSHADCLPKNKRKTKVSTN